MSYSPLSFLMISGSIPAAPPPRKPLSVVADLIVQPAGAVLELCCCGAPLGTAASAAQCWGSAGHRRTPQLQVRMRCHTSFSRTWRLQATFCILQNTAPHLKPVQWVTRYWTKSVAHCYAFGNAGSVLSNSTVSVTCCLWQSLCAQSWSIYSIFCVLAWMFHVCIRTWRSGPKLKSS